MLWDRLRDLAALFLCVDLSSVDSFNLPNTSVYTQPRWTIAHLNYKHGIYTRIYGVIH
ncbi:hypothetical protein CP162_00120 [Corynebacterium pseudotuberculosis Cp162]|nr:hypothetical protein CP162_00120 [Corynebacterium pseudotuberculosis Cp162]APG80743.1 hypothetical protein CPI37_0023 [Corynebacterium pseudotuberculosis]